MITEKGQESLCDKKNIKKVDVMKQAVRKR